MNNEFNNLNDKEFLNWIYERLKYKYKEMDEYDYMRRLASIIDKLPRV